MVKKVFLCENTQEGIFTAVYEAWELRNYEGGVKICFDGYNEYDLFSEYIEVNSDSIKAEKVLEALKRKFPAEITDNILYAIISDEEDKADVIFHFIIKLFNYGKDVVYNIGDEVIARMFDINRSMGREIHYYLEFLRFEESEDNTLYAVYNPKGRITPMIAAHFADRLNTEKFVIVDVNHNEAAFYMPDTGVILSTVNDKQVSKAIDILENTSYKSLWKIFFNSVNIKERENFKLQRNNLPLRFRTYMPEFNTAR